MQVEGSSVRVSSPTAPLATQVIKTNWGVTIDILVYRWVLPIVMSLSIVIMQCLAVMTCLKHFFIIWYDLVTLIYE